MDLPAFIVKYKEAARCGLLPFFRKKETNMIAVIESTMPAVSQKNIFFTEVFFPIMLVHLRSIYIPYHIRF